MDEEYQQSSVDNDAVAEPVADPPVSLLQSGDPEVTTLPSQQLTTPCLSQPSEATVTFPPSCSTSASFSSSYLRQGVDLTALTPGDMPSGFGGDMAHKCVKCSSSFNSSYELSIHWQEEHRENYKCKRCERCFAKKHNLLRHNCVNACNICGQQFTRRYNLKLHMQVHGDGSKMYKCEYCGKSFTRRYTLLTHTRSHSGIKLFKCSICGKAFTRQHTLNLHLKRHVQGQSKASFFCRKCYAVFNDAVSLQLHRENEHSKAKKEQTVQNSAMSQAVQSSANVVFPNNCAGYIYGTENVSLPESYHVGPYYQQEDVSQLQNIQRDGSSSNPNIEQGSFNDSKDNSLMLEKSRHPASLEKQHWFNEKDDSQDSSPGQHDPPALEENSAVQGSSTNIVTVVDSEDEALKEPQCSNELVDVSQGTIGLDDSGCGSEVHVTVGRDTEPVEETRRSLFPMDNSKRDKRMGHRMHRPFYSGWKHGDRMVKETSEIRIDIVDPNSLEEINPPLTPPRSSDTSTPRLNQASSESGSPSTASILEMSPTYTSQHHASRMKQSQGATAGVSQNKSCSSSRLPSQEQPALHKNTAYRSGDKMHSALQPGGNSSDCSSSEMAAQHIAKHSKDNPDGDVDTKWRCAHCGITFEESLMYVVHMGCHGQLDPFQCSMCGLKCLDRMAFTLHIIGGKHIHVRPKS
ncbi:protein hunchback-like [Acanthaster planci]|uniref:Protein hunchback-like n=1 Tax=Acanthaster planci TaxID=133434 RepID=A0A8B7ZH34_ACAPL|nr:protein hunchback-like [Acanthaster planci]XP_022104899.1 protein hunchback-like [Acanthaster planci]